MATSPPKRLPRGGDYIKYLWLPSKKWSKGKVIRRKKTTITFVGDSDQDDAEPWQLDINASKWEILDKPDVEVNTSEDSADDDDPKPKKKPRKRSKKKTEATTKRLPPWKAFGDKTEVPGFHCVHHLWQREGVQVGAEVHGPLLGSFYCTRLMFTGRWHEKKLRQVNFCQLQVLSLADGHYAVPRHKDVTLVTWRCRVQITPVDRDKWGDMVGDPTILVAHWCEEPERVNFSKSHPATSLTSHRSCSWNSPMPPAS